MVRLVADERAVASAIVLHLVCELKQIADTRFCESACQLWSRAAEEQSAHITSETGKAEDDGYLLLAEAREGLFCYSILSHQLPKDA